MIYEPAMVTDDLRGVPAVEFIAAEYGITPDQVRRTTDDLRTRAREAAEAYAPMNEGLVSADTMGERWAYSDGFRAGFLAHAAQQPTREQIAEVLWNRANRWEPGMLPFNDICSVEREYWMKDADAVLALFDGAGS